MYSYSEEAAPTLQINLCRLLERDKAVSSRDNEEWLAARRDRQIDISRHWPPKRGGTSEASDGRGVDNCLQAGTPQPRLVLPTGAQQGYSLPPQEFVLFMREYYWLHEKNLKGAKDSGNDHVWAKIRRPIVKIQSV